MRISVLATLALCCSGVHVASAASPCAPSPLLIDGSPAGEVQCRTESGDGVRNGELFSTDFASGTASSILSAVWGGKLPTVASDSTAMSGRSLQFDWDPGFENYNGVFKTIPGTRRKLHVRIRLKQGPGGSNRGIQKIIRFRPSIDGVERAAGTVNFQWGTILFGGDDFGTGETYSQSQAQVATHGPDTFVGRWRYLEAMLDYSDLSVQKFAVWVDGTKIIDGSVPLRSPLPASLNMNGVMILGTFNGPATDRMDYIDKIDISANYMGVP